MIVSRTVQPRRWARASARAAPRRGRHRPQSGRTAATALPWLEPAPGSAPRPLITISNAIMAAALPVGALLRAGTAVAAGDPSQALAIQAFGPRLALACVCILAVRSRSLVALTALGTVTRAVQAFDAVTGAVQGHCAATVIPAVLAVLQCWAIAASNDGPRAGSAERGDGPDARAVLRDREDVAPRRRAGDGDLGRASEQRMNSGHE